MQRKYMDPAEFREEGYLQEVNRRFFHPLGLAIEMVMNKPGEPEEPYAIVTVRDLDHLRSLLPDVPEDPDKRTDEDKLVHKMYERIDKAIEQSNRAIFSGVWDSRDDPEGINFGLKPEFEHGGDPEDFAAKARNINDEWNNRKRARVEALRYMVQPAMDDYDELKSDIVKLYGQALGDEMHTVIPVKASSESWQKAARGVLDRICQMFAEEPYNPTQVTAEEVHLIDLLLGPEAVSGALTRAEAVNMVIDRGKEAAELAAFYKDVFESASSALARIRSGDFPPGMSPQEFADEALALLAGDLGG